MVLNQLWNGGSCVIADLAPCSLRSPDVFTCSSTMNACLKEHGVTKKSNALLGGMIERWIVLDREDLLHLACSGLKIRWYCGSKFIDPLQATTWIKFAGHSRKLCIKSTTQRPEISGSPINSGILSPSLHHRRQSTG